MRRRLLRKLTFRKLIGKKVVIEHSLDPSIKGLEGTILSETRNVIIIKTSSGRVKRILKKGVLLTIYVSRNKKISVPGYMMIGRPEERVKKAYSRG